MVTTVAVPARSLVTSFDCQCVVVSCEAGIRSRPPLPLNRHASTAISAERPLLVHWIDTTIQSTARHRPRQAGKEYFIVSLHWQRRHPCLRHRVERSGTAGSTRREDNLCVWDS